MLKVVALSSLRGLYSTYLGHAGNTKSTKVKKHISKEKDLIKKLESSLVDMIQEAINKATLVQ
jgi:hypothetical protein